MRALGEFGLRRLPQFVMIRGCGRSPLLGMTSLRLYVKQLTEITFLSITPASRVTMTPSPATHSK